MESTQLLSVPRPPKQSLALPTVGPGCRVCGQCFSPHSGYFRMERRLADHGFAHGFDLSADRTYRRQSAVTCTLSPLGRLDTGKVFSPEVSEQMRALMRLTVIEGTGRQADVPGYLVGGKTGTAEKPGEGVYQKHATLSSFVGVFPMDRPRYLVLVVLDEPVGTKETFNFSGGGWVAAPPVGRVIARIAPILGVEPLANEVRGYQEVALLISDIP
ncbi:MAG: hypothetical protein IIA70_08115 [Proteobacteria bacterium]|nr:hypothetical protein [Pseudomonadota bacterium]